jgi:RNA polymerase sigma factor (sigma-70 family)
MESGSQSNTKSGSSAFATTRWTIVLRSGADDEQGRAALQELCRAYWMPIYVFLRRRGYSAHDAEDHTQSFLADLIRRGSFKRADPQRGRFRSFILSSLTNYLYNAYDRSRAQRRGGDVEKLSLDAAEHAVASVEWSELSPDAAFDRSWALALFDRAYRQLEAEQARLGKAELFKRLKPLMQQRAKPGEYDAIAAEFGLSRNAVAVAVHRLTARFREYVRMEVLQTVDGENEAEAELRTILGLFS